MTIRINVSLLEEEKEIFEDTFELNPITLVDLMNIMEHLGIIVNNRED